MRTGLTFGVSLLALAAGAPVLAQTVPAPPVADDPTTPQSQAEDTGQDVQGEEIIVTAAKRELTLQDTPIAVSVVNAETIEEAQIRDLIDLQTVVPSLRVQQSSSTSQANFFIRGFGNGANNPGIEPSVGVFIDGVYRSRSAAQIGDLPNIERVEVLRGPQSTLFGKNASAGVISVVTQRPQFQFGGSVAATYGNFDQIVLKGDITGPITETIAFSLAGNYNKRDGYVRVINLDRSINNRDRYDIRGQLLFRPVDDLEVRIIGDYSKIDELCCAGYNVVAGPTTAALNAIVGGPALVPQDPRSDTIRLNRVPENEIENYGVSGQIDYMFGGLTLTSITAYRELRSLNVDDGDFTQADITTNTLNTSIDTFTQELRLASNFDGPINFLVGGFYFDEKIRYQNNLEYGTQTRRFLDIIGGGALAGVETVLRLLGRPVAAPFAQPGLIFTDNFDYKNESFSLFGTVDFEVTDRLTLTGGLNYTEDRKRVVSDVASRDAFSAVNLRALVTSAIAAGFPPAAVNPLLGATALQFLPPFLNFPNAVESGRTKDDDLAYTLRAAYEASDRINVYATYATGFKATSFNLSRDSRPFASDLAAIQAAGIAPTNLTTGTRFAEPEEAELYEIGLKAAYPRVTFNIALFDQTIKGFQDNTFTGTGFALSNAGEQSTRGFEFEGAVTPVDPLTVFVSFSYLDAKYDEYVGSPQGDISGADVEEVSPFNLSLGATYTQEFSGDTRLVLRSDYLYSGTAQVDQGDRRFRRDVDELNVSATLQLSNGLEVSAYARNLLNDRYLIAIFPGLAQPGSVYGFLNQPRSYGGSVRFKF